MRKLLLVSIVLICGLSGFADAKPWRGIVPLHSTRADVERLLGRPTGPLPTYYLSDNTVTFWYSHCRCGEKCKDDDWNVPVDTVISIHVDLKGVFRLADLGLDLSQFKKSRLADDVPGSFIYSNAKEGFAIEGGVEYVSTLIYGPRAEDDHLRCRHNSSPSQTEAKEWRGIVPLHSTRADVERLLGKPNARYDRYDIENEQAEFFYSTGRCANGWDVPPDTVIDIAVTFKQATRLSDLNVDLRKYERFRNPHVTSHIYYVNRDEGIRYVVSEGGGDRSEHILTVYYESTSEDERVLYCRKSTGSADIEPCVTPTCPVIVVACRGRCAGPEYTFLAFISGPCPDRQPTYKWTVSAGKIMEGQGTDTIRVNKSDGSAGSITVTVEIGNAIPNVCPRKSSYTTECAKSQN